MRISGMTFVVILSASVAGCAPTSKIETESFGISSTEDSFLTAQETSRSKTWLVAGPLYPRSVGNFRTSSVTNILVTMLESRSGPDVSINTVAKIDYDFYNGAFTWMGRRGDRYQSMKITFVGDRGQELASMTTQMNRQTCYYGGPRHFQSAQAAMPNYFDVIKNIRVTFGTVQEQDGC